jgi:hypothetical protein
MFNLIFGAIAMGCIVAGVFFLRFWRETRDRLFFMFAMAFFLLAVERVVLALKGAVAEDRVAYLYLLRLAAFLLILIAILDKNRGRAGRGG